MRTLIFSSLVYMLAVGCSIKPTPFGIRDSGDESQHQAAIVSQARYEELDALLSSDLEVRNLKRAKSLIQELKDRSTKNLHVQKELSNKEQWVNESIEAKAKIQSLNEEITRLKAEVMKHQQALDEVRRTLVGQ